MKHDFEELECIYSLLKKTSKKFPERAVLSEFINNNLVSLKYFELVEAVEKKTIELQNLGIKQKSNIAISGSNSINWVITFFSIINLKCTAVPIDPKMNQKSMEFILNFTNAKLFLVDNIKNFKISPVLEKITYNMNSVIIKLENESNKELQSLILLKNIETTNRQSNNIAQILFTSGTTGDPKGVILTHKNLLSNIADIHEILPLQKYEKSFSILPLHHVYELTCSLLHNISKGNCIHFCSRIDISTLTKEMKAINPTVWPVVPLILEKIYKKAIKNISSSKVKRSLYSFSPKLFGLLIKKALGLKNINLILSGGAPLNLEVEKFFSKIGLPITQGYGLSEASPLISVNPLGKQKFGSVGKVIRSCEIKIQNPNDKGHGVIFAKGPNIFSGYYKNESTTSEVLKDGWLNTGDIGYLDNDKYLYITGREKFVIVNKGGKNIYPEEIEETFILSEMIDDIVVFSNDDININAIIKPDESITRNKNLDEVKDIIYKEALKLNKNLESFKRITKVYITLEDFEKTSTQKIKRSFLKNINLEKYLSAN